MAISPYEEVFSQAQRLTKEEQLRLLEALAALVRREVAQTGRPSTPPTEVADDETVEGYDPSSDPLARFAGIFADDEPGWMNRHDEVYGADGEENAEG